MVDERNERSGTSFVGSFLVLAIGNPLDMSSPYMKYDREIQSGERQRDTKRRISNGTSGTCETHKNFKGAVGGRKAGDAPLCQS
jgi:hypothetical protein